MSMTTKRTDRPGGPVRICCRHPGTAWLSPLDRRELRAALTAMLAAASDCGAPEPPVAVELLLLDDARICRANRRYMGCEGPTNVLSFPGGPDGPGALLLSLDALRRECLLYGQDAREHLLRLLSHGMGHLCGLDHGPDMDALCARLLGAAVAALA